MKSIIVEILNPHKTTHMPQLPQRFSFDEKRIVIGRAYDCDLSLGDPFIAPHHLEIIAHEESFEVRDLDTKNGFRLDDKNLIKADSLKVESGQSIVLGTMKIRIYSPRHEVQSEREMAPSADIRLFLSRPLHAFLFLMAVTILFVFSEWYESLQKAFWTEEGLYTLIAVPCFVLLFSFLVALCDFSKTHHFRFSLAVGLVSLCVLAVSFLDHPFDYMKFLFFEYEVDVFVSMALFCTEMFMIFTISHIIYSDMIDKRYIAAYILLALWLSGALFFESWSFGYHDDPRYDGTILPYANALIVFDTPEEFLTEAEALF